MNRRNLLQSAAAALLLPAAAALVGRAAAHDIRFAPPPGSMLYTRRIERSLADGAVLAVSRAFEVRFEQSGTGYRVGGEQARVDVEAPDKLAEFARLERERREEGVFPLLLDSRGIIVDRAAAPVADQLDAAVREAVAQIDRRPRPAEERAELLQFVSAIQQGAARLTTELPADLFAPPPEPRSERREVPLPGGDQGEVTVTFTASINPATGLMQRARREVVTELAGDRRLTVESWRLAPLA